MSLLLSKSLYMKVAAADKAATETKAEPKAEEVWRVWLDRQDLNELRETAKKVSTKVSGNKQEVRDAIVAKFTVYEDLYKGMTKAELFDVGQTRGVKGVSTLTKDPLINRLIRSFFEIEKKIVIPVAVAITCVDNDLPVTLSKKVEAAEAKAPLQLRPPSEAIKAAAEAKAAKAAEVAEAIKAAVAADAKKKAKAAIPKKVKTDVWNTYIGADINKHRCLCCKKTVISNTDFDVGHVTSESTGGTLEIGNLRPICSACNHSMGTRNMVDFVKMFGYFIG